MVSSAYVKKAMIALLSVLLLCCLLASPAQAWTSSLQSSSSLASSVSSRGNSFANRRWTSMMFNFGGSKPSTNVKKSLPITIKVRNEKKDFTVAEGSSSGGVNLRKVLLENKVDVYPLQAKILGNCGGGGICGTCAVKIVSGQENCNAPSKNEINTITTKRPKDKDKIGEIRLSCCTRVTGPVEILTKA